MPTAAFFDLDGTLTTDRVWKGIMAYFRQRESHRWLHRWFLTVHYPLYFLRRARLISESGMRRPWAAHLAWYFRGLSIEQAAEVGDWIATRFLRDRWRTDMRAILDEHRQRGEVTMLVSSGPLPMLERIAHHLGMDYAVGTALEVRNGHYTGRSRMPVCIDEYKAILAKQRLEAEKLTVDFAASHAYADSISDLALLEMVGHPVAVYPDARLRAIAVERGWQILPT